jgi:hypothetical protein
MKIRSWPWRHTWRLKVQRDTFGEPKAWSKITNLFHSITTYCELRKIRNAAACCAKTRGVRRTCTDMQGQWERVHESEVHGEFGTLWQFVDVIRWYQMLHPHFFRWLARSQGEKVLKTDISGLQQLSKTCVQAKMASGWTPPPGAGWPGLFKQQHAATKIGCNEATRIGMNRKMRSFGEVYLLYSIYGSVYSWGNW